MENCPNCNSKISTSLWKTNNLIAKEEVVLAINTFLQNSATGYCENCFGLSFHKASLNSSEIINECKNNLFKFLNSIPIVSCHSPTDWKYTTIEIVTAQIVIGTGLLTELSSSISDLFGNQSQSLRSKIIEGEDLCYKQLRKSAIEKGGNAILAVDIDYSELGGAKGMIMVCMTGTAVHVDAFAKVAVYDELKQKLEHYMDLVKYLR